MTATGGTAERGPDTSASGYQGLLTQIMTNTMDADYEVVARNKPPAEPQRSSAGAGLLAAAVIFGVMIGVSALRTEQNRPQADAERAEIVDQIHIRQDRLDAMHRQLTDLQDQVTTLQTELSSDVNSGRSVSSQLRSLGAASGALAVTGPGMVITVDDADSSQGPGGTILDTDLQGLVNGLWEAGAEAIAIDGYRLTTLTAIRFAGEAITVDYRSLTPPYVITAIGDPGTMPARLLQTPAGQTWLGLRTNFGISFETEVKDKLLIPADPHDHLLYARESGGAS
jgi:uncharacterized protein YlxW (UPF0749 family)